MTSLLSRAQHHLGGAMASLRRRLFGTATPEEQSRTPSPVRRHGKDDPVPVPAEKLEKINKTLKKPKGSSKRSFAWIFGLGGLFGVFVAAFFAKENDMIDMAWLESMNLDSVMDVLPAGLMQDARAFQVGRYCFFSRQLRLTCG